MSARIGLYGFQRLGAQVGEFEQNGVRFVVMPLLEINRFENFDLVITVSDPFTPPQSENYEAYNLQLLSNFRLALEAGTHVCVLENGMLSDCAKHGRDYQKSVGYKLMYEDLLVRADPIEWTNTFSNLNRNFESFFKQYGVACAVFTPVNSSLADVDVLGELTTESPVALSKKKGKGRLIFLPARPLNFKSDFVSLLASSCLSCV